MTDTQLAAAYADAERIEREIRRHLAITSGAFEQDRGQAAYRVAVSLRMGLERWITTRALGPRPVTHEER